MPDNVVDTLRVRVEEAAGDNTKEIGRLIGALTRLKETLAPLQSMKLNSFFTSTAVENAKGFAAAVNSIDTAKLKELASLDLSNLSKAMNASGMKDYSESLGSIENGLKRVYNLLNERFAPAQKTAEQATAKATTAIRQQTKAAQSHHKSFSLASTALGKFFNSIKRIAFYRMIRGAIKAVTQGFSEGIQNLYFWSQAVGTSFAPAMDRLATATLYLKNGFASMWSPLIEKAIPIIDKVIDKLVDFFNFVQEGFARLFELPTWNKALRYPVQFAENTEGATKAAKALHNILMGFDELNVINTPTDSGRGKAGDEKDYASMFKLMETQTTGGGLENWAGRFRRLIDTFAPAFAPLQRVIDSTKETIKTLIDETGEWIDKTDFKPLADSVGNVNGEIADLVETLNGDFVTTYKKVVLPIATWLVEAELPDTLNNVASAIGVVKSGLHALNIMFTAFWDNTEELREYLKEFFHNRHQEIQDFLDKIKDWLADSTPTFERLGAAAGKLFNTLGKILIPLFDLIAKVGWQPFVTGIGLILEALTPLLDALAVVLDLISTILDKPLELLGSGLGITGKLLTGDFAGAIADLKSGVNEIITGGFFKEWGDDFDAFLQRTKEASNGVKGWFKERLGLGSEHSEQGGGRDFNLDPAVLEAQAVMKAGEEGGKKTFGERIEEIKTQITNFKEWCKNNFIVPVKILSDNIREKVSEKWNEFKQWWIDKVETIKLIPVNIKELVLAKWEEFKTWWRDKTEQIKLIVPNIKEKVREKWESFKSWWTTLGINLKINFPNLIQMMREKWENFKAWWRTLSLPSFHISLPHLVVTQGSLNPIKWFAEGLPKIEVQWYAKGGFPSPGQMFYAGEGGIPEIMGKVNGRSAVVGGAEITGISDTIRAQGAREEQLLQAIYDALVAKDFSFVPNAASGRLINQALRQYSGVTG